MWEAHAVRALRVRPRALRDYRRDPYQNLTPFTLSLAGQVVTLSAPLPALPSPLSLARHAAHVERGGRADWAGKLKDAVSTAAITLLLRLLLLTLRLPRLWLSGW